MTLTEHKILNGIKYFVKNTKNVGRTKLFKLLYFWDFEHFKKTGYSITGFEYFTYPFEPGSLSFLTKYTCLELSRPVIYYMYEIYESIKLKDKIEDDNLLRRIKNCIDFDSIEVKFARIIKNAFKK